MAETNSSMPEYVFHDGTHSVGPLMLGFSRFAAAFCVAVAIVGNWTQFGSISKLLAVMLMADVLFSTSIIRWREKRSGKKVESSVLERNGYTQLMIMALLMMMLFVRNH